MLQRLPVKTEFVARVDSPWPLPAPWLAAVCTVRLIMLALECVTIFCTWEKLATKHRDLQEPVLGAGLAWAVLGERWGAWGWVGAALILVSSLSAQIFGSSCAEK